MNTNKRKTIICKECGKEVITTSNRQLYCVECGKMNRRTYQTNYIRQYRKTKHGSDIFKRLQFKRRKKINRGKIIETYTMKQWFNKLDATEGICPVCHKFVGKDKLSIDHTYPVSKATKGRVYTIDDVSPMCRACNSRKSNKVPQ